MAESYYESLQNDVINSFGGVTAGANDAVKFGYDLYGSFKLDGKFCERVENNYYYNLGNYFY